MNPKTLAILAAGLVLLGGLFVLLQPGDQPAPPATTPVAEPAPPPAPREVVVAFTVRDGKRTSGPELVAARQGEVLRLAVESSHADELHLHGYDITVPLSPNERAELRLPLTHSGRFEIELHHAHGVLTVLEVQPTP